jgi:sterol desaturase/sphingolipid hydroxylase (fatty acid hydroxylase superfamily)
MAFPLPDPAHLEALRPWRGPASLLWLALLLTWESLAPFLPLFRGSAARLRHGLRNYGVAILNGLLAAVLFAWLWQWLAQWAERHGFGLLHWTNPWLSGWPRVLVAILLFDLWTYAWHRAAHVLPGLWQFHRMHHSDPQMDATTANRFHPVEILISSVLRLAVIPLLGLRFGEVVLYETLLQLLVQTQHANVAWPGPVERVLRLVFITPLMHKVHHSRLQPETDSNYGSLCSFWDRLFRSFRLRPDPERIQFGLDGYDTDAQQTLRGLWRTPWERK